MTWLVTGATGRLGRRVRARFEAVGVPVVGLSRRPDQAGDLSVDLADGAAALGALDALAPTHVLHLAACSSVDLASADPEHAWAVNAVASATLARWCADRGARMTLISSDFVFPGRPGGAYAEEDPVRPVNPYGESKVAAERAVLEAPDALVLRSSLLYGAQEDSFGLLDRVVRHARRGEPLHVTRRELRTPLHVDDAARAVVHLTMAGVAGVVNLAGPQVLSAADIAGAVCSWHGSPLSASVLDDEALRPGRPGDVSLDDARLRSLGASWIRELGPWVLDPDASVRSSA